MSMVLGRENPIVSSVRTRKYVINFIRENPIVSLVKTRILNYIKYQRVFNLSTTRNYSKNNKVVRQTYI